MRTPLILTILAVVVAIGGAAYIVSRHSSGSPVQVNGSQAIEPNTVVIANYMFTPMSITAKVGSVVTWKNSDLARHTITADNPSSDAPASMLLAQGESYRYTFTKTGTYTYHCEPHPYMKATITITQ